MKKHFHTVLIVLCTLFVLIAPLGFRDLFTPDETRYAEIPREMLESGNFITPYLNGVTYFEKPVFGYWILAASMRIFGENPFAVRLPCMLAAIVSALCVMVLARKLNGGEDRRLPLLAGGVFLTFPMTFVLGGYAVLDMMFGAFVSLAMLFFFLSFVEKWSLKKVLYLFLFGMACGLAFLTKGFLGFALPGAAIFFFLLIPAELPEFRTRGHWGGFLKNVVTLPWIPLAGVLITVLPWALAIHREQPEFWNYFFWEEHIRRFTSSERTQHQEPFWFFLPILFGGIGLYVIWLWNVLGGLRRSFSRRFRDPVIRYAFCWLVFQFLLLSSSSGKLGTYIVPCFPAAALLVTAGLYASMNDGTKFVDFVMKFLGLALTFAAPLFLAWEITFPQWSLYRYPGEFHKNFLLAAVGLATALLVFAAFRAEDRWKKLFLTVLITVPGILSWHFLVPQFAMEKQAPYAFLKAGKAKLEAENCGEPVLISFRYPFQDVCWVFKRNDVWMYLSAGELEEGMAFQKSEHRCLHDNESASKMIEAFRKMNRPVLLILPNDIFEEEKQNLPEPSWRISSDLSNDDAYSICRF